MRVHIWKLINPIKEGANLLTELRQRMEGHIS